MTTKTIANTIINGGYVLSSSYSAISVASTGTIFAGLTIGFSAHGSNAGLVSGATAPEYLTGVSLRAGGVFSNIGSIAGGAGRTGDSYYYGTHGDPGGSGGPGIVASGASETVFNSGVIIGGAGGQGGPGTAAAIGYYGPYVPGVGGQGGFGGDAVDLYSGGEVVNTGRLSGGFRGARGFGSNTMGAYGYTGIGVHIAGGGTVVNGRSASPGAQIYGGVYAQGAAAVVVNLATIAAGAGPYNGMGYKAILLRNGGRIANGDASDSSALISGDVAGAAATTMTNFATIDGNVEFSGAGDSFFAHASSTVTGAVSCASGGALNLVSGAETLTGMGATSTITGAISLQAEGFSTYVVGAAASLTLAGVNELHSGDHLIGAGTTSLAAGATLTVDDGALVKIGGAVANAGTLSLDSAGSATQLFVLGAGATLSGGGTIDMGGAHARLFGSSSAVILDNVDNTIAGSGVIGLNHLSLVNAGVIDGDGTGRLSIETGSQILQNSGLIENTGAGGTVIVSAVNNSGTLAEATAGTLTLEGAVTGAGQASVDGGVLFVVQAFGENVSFLGTTGVLKLGDSQGYAGDVTGFSKTRTTSLDLTDIGFAIGTTTASYSGTTAGGTLTVTDGTHTAHIALDGDYLGTIFKVSSDGHGGTTVIDAPGAPSPVAPLVQAMALFQAGPPPDLAGTPAYEMPRRPMFLAHGGGWASGSSLRMSA